MSIERAARFVGLYASFPVERELRRVELLEHVLALEEQPSFKKMDIGQTLGKHHVSRYDETRLERALEDLARGAVDYLHLLPFWENSDWAKSFETSVMVYWNSSVAEPEGANHSPYLRRFGFAGELLVEYPISRFRVDSESPFQRSLLGSLKEWFREFDLHWLFVHQGCKPLDGSGLGLDPTELGRDGIFLRTREQFPLTSFDTDLTVASAYYKEYAKGAFWANFLNARHLGRLGGTHRILQESPCDVIEDLGEGRLLLQVNRSPIEEATAENVEKYQRLREFLRPILLETPEDVARLTAEVMGSWTPSPTRGRY